MAGGNCDATGIVAYQMAKTGADLGGCVSVVGKNEDTARILAPHPDEIGNPVD
jgi:hypothetical protein